MSFTAMLPCKIAAWGRQVSFGAMYRSGLFLLTLMLLCAGAQAQGYPVKPLRLIVADAAGGAPDQLGRIVAQKLSENLGQPGIVDNRPGAPAALGADIAARSPADGYTLLP